MLVSPVDCTRDSTHKLFDTGVSTPGRVPFGGKLEGRSGSLVLTTVYSIADGADLRTVVCRTSFCWGELDGAACS